MIGYGVENHPDKTESIKGNIPQVISKIMSSEQGPMIYQAVASRIGELLT